MPEPLADKVVKRVEHVAELYHRLILVVAPSGDGKTQALRHVSEHLRIPIINVNLELSKALLDLTIRQRALQLPNLLLDIVERSPSEIVILDNIEVLFDAELKQDPLRLLQRISRTMTVIAAWNGIVDKDHVIYADPKHREYRRYPRSEVIAITPDGDAKRSEMSEVYECSQ